MPSAAPGVIARAAMRQLTPKKTCLPDLQSIRVGAECLLSPGSGSRCSPGVQHSARGFYFTRLLSVIRVARGRLGEVESLVGDCRPPPPGNPHRPPTTRGNVCSGVGMGQLPSNPTARFLLFHPRRHKNGGIFFSDYLLLTFKYFKIHHNLKKLIPRNNFKNINSFFPCTDICSVLEFRCSSYHLYGVLVEETPPIALTNVLRKRDCGYALSVL